MYMMPGVIILYMIILEILILHPHLLVTLIHLDIEVIMIENQNYITVKLDITI